jgi:phage baseplate assembly protein W
MIAKGNSDVKLCVQNLLRIFRGECAYERIKGIDPRMIDKPMSAVEPEIRQDAEWLIETYEPRAAINGITVSGEDAVGGGFTISADIARRE